MENFKFILASLVVALISACAYPHRVPEKPEEALTPTDAAAARLEASFVTEVGFEEKESALGADDHENLRKLIQESRKVGPIEEVKIISWGDKGYPSEDKGRLPRAESELAAQRARSIREFLASFDIPDIVSYNMAERPNALEKLLDTSDARVKRALEASGLVGPSHLIDTKSSRAVVLVILEK